MGCLHRPVESLAVNLRGVVKQRAREFQRESRRSARNPRGRPRSKGGALPNGERRPEASVCVSLGRSVVKRKAGQLSLDGLCANRLVRQFGGFSKTSPTPSREGWILAVGVSLSVSAVPGCVPR